MVEVQRWEQRRMRLEGCCFMFKWTTCFQDFKYTQLLLTLMSLLELTPLPEERLRGERNRDFIQTTTTNTLKESLLLSMIYIVNNWAGFKTQVYQVIHEPICKILSLFTTAVLHPFNTALSIRCNEKTQEGLSTWCFESPGPKTAYSKTTTDIISLVPTHISITMHECWKWTISKSTWKL